MEFVDLYISRLINNAPQKLSEQTLDNARIAAQPFNVEMLQSSLEAAKLIVEPSHMRLIIDSDMNADSLPRCARIDLLKSWSASKMFPKSPSLEHSVALDACLASEIALAEDINDPMNVLYHRTRSFVYTMIFLLKPHLIHIFLLSQSAIEYTCAFALVTVLLDDAEDAEEDTLANSPTLFSSFPNVAGEIALGLLAFIESANNEQHIGGIPMLPIKPFLLLAVYQVRVFLGLEPARKTVDTRQFLKMLAQEKNWRGRHKLQDSE